MLSCSSDFKIDLVVFSSLIEIVVNLIEINNSRLQNQLFAFLFQACVSDLTLLCCRHQRLVSLVHHLSILLPSNYFRGLWLHDVS